MIILLNACFLQKKKKRSLMHVELEPLSYFFNPSESLFIF